jgi:preprotein translocase subunit SecD
MDELFQQLPGRLDRLADRLTATAFAPDPAVLRRRGRHWRRRRWGAGVVLGAAVLGGLVVGTGRVLDHRPAPIQRQHQVSLALAATTPDGGRPDGARLAATARILRARLEAAGIQGGSVQARGSGLLVEVPAAQWRDDLTALLATPGRLELRPVIAQAAATDPRAPFSRARCTATPPAPAAASGQQAVVCLLPQGAANAASATTKLLVGPAALGNADIASVKLEPPPPGTSGAAWQVVLTLTGPGGQAFQQLTDAAACQPAGSVRRQIAIVVDGTAIQAPPVATDVRCGQGLPSGAAIAVTGLAEREARILYALLANQPLPLHVEP